MSHVIKLTLAVGKRWFRTGRADSTRSTGDRTIKPHPTRPGVTVEWREVESLARGCEGRGEVEKVGAKIGNLRERRLNVFLEVLHGHVAQVVQLVRHLENSGLITCDGNADSSTNISTESVKHMILALYARPSGCVEDI